MNSDGDGSWSTEVKLTWLGLEFRLARNQDVGQSMYPDVMLDEETGMPVGPGGTADPVAGPDSVDKDIRWKVDGSLGDTFKITFTRNPKDFEELDVTWAKISSGPPVEPEPRYFLVLEDLGWGAGGFVEMKKMGKIYLGEYKLKSQITNFSIMQFKRADLCIRPDKEQCSQQQAHKVLGPTQMDLKYFWSLGKSAADKAKINDTFHITYDPELKKVNWKRK